jgi:predicted ATP-binding protein involved in virulence
VRYKRFVINNYRAITGPLEIDRERRALTPIIGVNESGNTTILHAIFAFDYNNDRLKGGRHLKDTSNLYRTSSPSAVIEALVEISKPELDEVISACAEANEPLPSQSINLYSAVSRCGLDQILHVSTDRLASRFSRPVGQRRERFSRPAFRTM